MATWQDLQRKQARSAAAAPAASPLAPGAVAVVPPVAAVAPAAASSPRLQALMAERQRLEGRMSSLVGGGDDRDAARYSVAPAAQRRAEAQQWLAQLCVENELTRLRLLRQLPPVGESSSSCEQAGQTLVPLPPQQQGRHP